MNLNENSPDTGYLKELERVVNGVWEQSRIIMEAEEKRETLKRDFLEKHALPQGTKILLNGNGETAYIGYGSLDLKSPDGIVYTVYGLGKRGAYKEINRNYHQSQFKIIE